MDRRGFLKGLGAVVAVPLAGGSDDYVPVGHLAVGEIGAPDVDRVFLDGSEVKHVYELNDVAGWVRHYGPNLETDPSGETLRTFHRTGTVRVTWQKPSPAPSRNVPSETADAPPIAGEEE